jgi:hypothetical protein
MPLIKEDERDNKICPLLNSQMPSSCVVSCKFGFRIMSDEQALEILKTKRNVITHKCLVRETLLSIYNNFNKKNDDGFKFEKKK